MSDHLSDKNDRWGDSSSGASSASPVPTDLSGRRGERGAASPGVIVKMERRETPPSHLVMPNSNGYSPVSASHQSFRHSEMSAVPHSVQSQVIHGPMTSASIMTSSVSARSLVQGLAANAYHHDDHGSGGTLVKAAYAGAGSMRPQGMGFEGPGHLLPTEDVEVFFHHLDNRPTATTVALAGFTLASVGAAANSSSESGTSFTPLTNATLSSGQTVYHNGDTVGLSGGSLITLQPPTYSDNSAYLPPMPSLLVPSSTPNLVSVGGYVSSGSAGSHISSQHLQHSSAEPSTYQLWGLHPSSDPHSHAQAYTPLPPASTLTSKHGGTYLTIGESGLPPLSQSDQGGGGGGRDGLSLSQSHGSDGYPEYVTNEGGSKWSTFNLTPMGHRPHDTSSPASSVNMSSGE